MTLLQPNDPSALAPEIDDLSIYIGGGRLTTDPPEDPRTGRSVRQSVADGVLAERLGFRRVFLSERHDIKEAGALLGGVAALTSRIDVGTGVIAAPSRPPRMAAALGATLHAAYGPRFVLGLGRTTAGFMGLAPASYPFMADYVDIVRRLWRGETVTYDGPVGSFDGLRMQDLYDGPPPQIWGAILGGPVACRSAAENYDGVILTPYLTTEAVTTAVTRIREHCEKIGRDPASIHIAHPIVTAPDLDEFETMLLCHARAVTYVQMQEIGEAYMKLNHWDPAFPQRLRDHPQIADFASADQHFHRKDLLGPASIFPDEWIEETCAVGSIDACVATLQRFRDTGVDELIVYGSAPGQNAALAEAWAARAEAVTEAR